MLCTFVQDLGSVRIDNQINEFHAMGFDNMGHKFLFLSHQQGKIGDSNACLYDDRFLRMTNIQASGLHPSALGMIDATGYERYVVPESSGGDAHGDIGLQSDRSVKLRIPAGELLLFQGVNIQ